jgi:hypothetical protein
MYAVWRGRVVATKKAWAAGALPALIKNLSAVRAGRARERIG